MWFFREFFFFVIVICWLFQRIKIWKKKNREPWKEKLRADYYFNVVVSIRLLTFVVFYFNLFIRIFACLILTIVKLANWFSMYIWWGIEIVLNSLAIALYCAWRLTHFLKTWFNADPLSQNVVNQYVFKFWLLASCNNLHHKGIDNKWLSFKNINYVNPIVWNYNSIIQWTNKPKR